MWTVLCEPCPGYCAKADPRARSWIFRRAGRRGLRRSSMASAAMTCALAAAGANTRGVTEAQSPPVSSQGVEPDNHIDFDPNGLAFAQDAQLEQSTRTSLVPARLSLKGRSEALDFSADAPILRVFFSTNAMSKCPMESTHIICADYLLDISLAPCYRPTSVLRRHRNAPEIRIKECETVK